MFILFSSIIFCFIFLLSFSRYLPAFSFFLLFTVVPSIADSMSYDGLLLKFGSSSHLTWYRLDTVGQYNRISLSLH